MGKEVKGARSIAVPRRALAAGLLAFSLALSGCGPAADQGAKPAATNVPAARLPGKTNQVPALRPGARTNLPPAASKFAPKGKAPVTAAPAVSGRTNAAVAASRKGTGTNALSSTTNTTNAAGFGDTLSKLSNNPAFYPVLGVLFVCLCLGVILVARLVQGKAAKAATGSDAAIASARSAKKKAKPAAVHSCNVMQVNPQSRQIWQFDARGRGFVLKSEQTSVPGEVLPARLVAKDWHSLFQRKLNVAWLPPERVFLRVAQFPASDFDETLSMVELQLEKLSPIPVAQIVWSLHILPHAEGNLQTVIVMIVARNEVEEFLGQLEGQGYLADRLELPLLDQLHATTINESGAWIYPETASSRNAALVAWWYGGVLQTLDLVTLPAADRAESVKEQLLQMAWAGEMEGWLTSPPTWHLVADPTTAADWHAALKTGLDQDVELIPPVPTAGLAALTATRAAKAGNEGNLLPTEYSTRYHQQFVDRLWMRGLAAVVGLYLLGVLVYFARLQWELYRTNAVEATVAEQGPIYTNALQLKAKYQVLKDRQDLKFAALDCWKAVAERLPENITLDGYNFSEGKKLTLSGSAPADQTKSLLDFYSDICKATINEQPLFDRNAGERVTWDVRGSVANWHCVLELKRAEGL